MAISVVIHTYNAAQYLATVIEHVKDFEEIIICDMESTDTTLDIARRYGCRVLSVEKKDYTVPEPYRDYAIHQASNPWVLVVDADELVPAALRDFLRAHSEREGAEAGVRIPRMNYVFGRFQPATYPDHQLRFFLRDKAHWPFRIHSLPEVDGDSLTIPASRKDLAMQHLQTDMRSQLVRINNYTDNELPRRRGRRASLWRFILEPRFRFIKSYIFKGGFLNGTSGYILAKRDEFYRYVMLAKLYEEQHTSSLTSPSSLRDEDKA
jgi:glycosyltransferase involved in cell wall biosynthesis